MPARVRQLRLRNRSIAGDRSGKGARIIGKVRAIMKLLSATIMKRNNDRRDRTTAARVFLGPGLGESARGKSLNPFTPLCNAVVTLRHRPRPRHGVNHLSVPLLCSFVPKRLLLLLILFECLNLPSCARQRPRSDALDWRENRVSVLNSLIRVCWR